MTANSKLRGWEIYYDGDQWRFTDNDQPTVETYQARPCGECSRAVSAAGPDPCIGWLKGVANACCGHGDPGDAYVMFDGGLIVRGRDALRHFAAVRAKPWSRQESGGAE